MIQQFNMRNLAILTNLGAEVHVAADFENFGTWAFDGELPSDNTITSVNWGKSV